MQRLFFLNAGCVHDAPGQVDASVVDRLLNQCDAMPHGFRGRAARLRLGARRRREAADASNRRSTCPTRTRPRSRAQHPERFEWAASIHPQAPDALARLDAAAAGGARAVKWLPSAQNIDPASPRCDAFYRRLAALRLPLLSHAGDERAVRGHDESLGNPLRLRRPLDAGVRVIVAHCASLGMGRDLDRPDAPAAGANFALFARLIDTPAYRDHVYGDLSAVAQGNRIEVLAPPARTHRLASAPAATAPTIRCPAYCR